MAILKCLDTGLDDMIGGLKIGLADPEVDNVAPLGREFSRAASTMNALSVPRRDRLSAKIKSDMKVPPYASLPQL